MQCDQPGFGGLVMNDNMDPAPPAATAGIKHTSASQETLCGSEIMDALEVSAGHLWEASGPLGHSQAQVLCLGDSQVWEG